MKFEEHAELLGKKYELCEQPGAYATSPLLRRLWNTACTECTDAVYRGGSRNEGLDSIHDLKVEVGDGR